MMSITCGGFGAGLPALPCPLLGPHVNLIIHTWPHARQDGAPLFLPNKDFPGLSVSRGVAHHVPVNVSLYWVPGHSGSVLCHLLSHQVFRAVNI